MSTTETPDGAVAGILAADTIEEAILLAVGGASMCWENPAGAGLFDNRRAALIGETLLDVVRGYVR